MKKFNIVYGVTKTINGAYSPVIFINDQTSSYSPHARKTAKGALNLVNKLVNEIKEDKERWGNKVILSKWEHSVI